MENKETKPISDITKWVENTKAKTNPPIKLTISKSNYDSLLKMTVCKDEKELVDAYNDKNLYPKIEGFNII